MTYITKRRYEDIVNQVGRSYAEHFEESVQLVNLLAGQLDTYFDVDAYYKANTHVESVKESILPFMKNISHNKNIRSLYVYFNPSLTGRPNDIWLNDQDSNNEFIRLSQVPVDYFDEYSSDKAWYFKTINSDEGVWIPPHYNAVFNSEELLFSYNQAVFKENMLIAVVGIELSTSNLEKIAKNFIMNCDCQMWVADNTGRLVFHPLDLGYQSMDDYFGYLDLSAVKIGQVGTFAGKGNETIKVIRLENDWLIGTTFFNSMLSKHTEEMKRILTIMIVISVGLMVGTSLFISRKISDPLERLTNEVELIESGTYEGNISEDILNQKSDIGHLALSIFNMVESKKNTYKEVGKQRDEIIQLYEETYAINADLENTLFQKEQLYDDLNIMFKKLEDANKELENRVNERTEELNEKNKALEGALKENKKNNRNLRKLNKDLEKSIKDLTLAQERLVESEKMVALGNMVSGIAHEINTPLGVSLTATSYVLDQIRELEDEMLSLSDEELIELMGEVEESSQIIYDSLRRSIELMSSFKEIAVNQHSNERLAFDLLEYTHTVTRSLKHEYSQVVERLDIEIPSGIEVYSYPGAYSQVITNLVMNSIKHGFESIENGHISIKAIKDKEDITLIYKDDGVGIKKTHLKKVFEPFFTTKRANGGTGLGLSIVYNLVNTSLMGEIECLSQVGKGTQFNISFPVNVEHAEIKE